MKKLLLAIYSVFILSLLAGNVSAQSHLADTSIAGAGNRYLVTVSPNPIEDEAILTVVEGSKKLTAIRIFDLIGKEVTYIDLRSKSGTMTYKLDFSSVKPGVYFCNIYGEHGIVETKKLFRTK